MKLQLLKTEAGWLHTRVGCYVSLDNQLLEVITPLNCPHESPTLDIPIEGTLRLIFKDMGHSEGYLSSLSLNLSHISKSCSMWLPLYSSPISDAYQPLTSDPSPPRILVNITVESSTIVDDELFHSFSDLHLENDSEVVVASQILPPGTSEPELCKTSTFKLPKTIGFIEKLALQLKKFMTLSSENKKLAMFYKEKCLELESRLGVSEDRSRELMEENRRLQEKCGEREEELTEKILEKDNEIKDLQQNLFLVSNELRVVEFEEFYLKETLKCRGKENQMVKESKC